MFHLNKNRCIQAYSLMYYPMDTMSSATTDPEVLVFNKYESNLYIKVIDSPQFIHNVVKETIKSNVNRLLCL